MKIFYSPNYVAREHDFATTRKASFVADCLLQSGFSLTEPNPVTYEQLQIVHTEKYLNALKTGDPRALAESDGFPWDNKKWLSICSTAGGMVDAAKTALQEGKALTLSSGFHHARKSKGRGFCAVAGLALAARLARREWAIERVAIVDFDAHGFGGNFSICGQDDGVYTADLTCVNFDPIQESKQSHRTHLHLGTENLYLDYAKEMLDWTLNVAKPDLVLYNAGMDPHERNDIGGTRGIDTKVLTERENMVASWAKEHSLPIAATIAGGYPGPHMDIYELAQLHTQTAFALNSI